MHLNFQYVYKTFNSGLNVNDVKFKENLKKAYLIMLCRLYIADAHFACEDQKQRD